MSETILARNLRPGDPVLTVASITGLVSALLVLAASFGVSITNGQRTAILAVVGAVVPIVLALWARSRVVPVARLEATPSGRAALETVEAAKGS